MLSFNIITRLKSKVFSLERLKKDFGSEEILGLKKVVKKILVGNVFGSKHILGPKTILGPKKISGKKILWVKTCLCPKGILDPKKCWLKKNFLPPKNF